MKIYYLIAILLLTTSCSIADQYELDEEEGEHTFFEAFNTQSHLDDFWTDASQNNSPQSYHLESGLLKITTRANETDRVKIKTLQNNFTVGTYQWEIYVPKFDLNEKRSIGAFLYSDDAHELDFEIGSGTNTRRTELNAQVNDMIVYCTSQNYPFSEHLFLIQANEWHFFKMKLSLGENNNYIVKWYIDNELVKTLQTNFNQEIEFNAFCSLENLNFMGDYFPTTENYTFFDSFAFDE